MTLDYVGGAYLVFALIMAWDFIAPRVKLSRVRRMIALRVRRETARKLP